MSEAGMEISIFTGHGTLGSEVLREHFTLLCELWIVSEEVELLTAY